MDLLKDSKSYYHQVKRATNFVHLSALEKPVSGSKWTFADILTFRVILQRQGNEFPPILKTFLPEADKRLKSEAFSAIVALVKQKAWEKSPRDKLRSTGEGFGSFLSHLAEVLEQPWSSEEVRVSNRPKRDDPLPLDYPQSDEEEEWAEEQELELSESSESSDHSHLDQNTINQQYKSEPVTRCLIIEYLQSLAQCTRGLDARPFHLEWTTDEDNFQFQVPSGSGLDSKNDGGLVHRSIDGLRRWARVKPSSCYCSIEAGICTRIPSVLANYAFAGESGTYCR